MDKVTAERAAHPKHGHGSQRSLGQSLGAWDRPRTSTAEQTHSAEVAEPEIKQPCFSFKDASFPALPEVSGSGHSGPTKHAHTPLPQPRRFVKQELARALIERIHCKLTGLCTLDPDMGDHVRSLQSSLSCALHVVSAELNAKSCHFLYELVQNADDNDYSKSVVPSLSFALTEDGLHVSNNELGFTSEDIEAICDVGASRKRWRKDRIGNKGIGFKSVFRYCTETYIRSGGFSFRFAAPKKTGGFTSEASGNAGSGLGLIAPEWVEPGHFPVPPCDGFETSIFLPSSGSREGWEHLGAELRQEFRPELMLFLRRLRVLELCDCRGFRRLTRTVSGVDDVITITVEEGTMEVVSSMSSETASYYLIRREAPIPQELSCPHHHGEQESAEVACAFLLDAASTLRSLDEVQVFAFLPICASGLHFVLHADFDIVAGRDDIKRGSAWNAWLCREAATIFVEAVVGTFGGLPEADVAWLSMLPLPGEILVPALQPFSDHLLELLALNPCVATGVQPARRLHPSGVLLCSAAFSGLFGVDWLRAATGLEPLSDRWDLARQRPALELLGCNAGVKAALQSCLRLELKLRSMPIEWFAELYRYLAEHCFEGSADFGRLRILPLRGAELTAAADGPVFLLHDEGQRQCITPPSEVRALHPELSAQLQPGAPARGFLLRLGLRPAWPSLVFDEAVLPRYRPEALPVLDLAASVGHLRYLQSALGIPTPDCLAAAGVPEWGEGEAGLLERSRSGLLLQALPASCGAGGPLATAWQPPGCCYLASEDLRALFQGSAGVWFASAEYLATGVSKEVLQLLGAHAGPRIEPAPQELVPWRDRERLAEELGWQPGPTFQHYALEARRFGSEVLGAAAGPGRAACLVQLLDQGWREIGPALCTVDVVAFHRDIRSGCRWHGLPECTDRQCAMVHTVTLPAQSVRLGALAALRRLEVQTSDGVVRPVGECFMQSPSLSEFFGEQLPYLGFKIGSSELCAALGITDSLTVEAVLARLAQLAPEGAEGRPAKASVPAGTLHTVRRMYAFLALHSHESAAVAAMRWSFAARPLIFTGLGGTGEGAQGEEEVTWSRTAHTRWAGDSALHRGCLAVLQSCHEASLRRFFVEAVGVAPHTSAEDALCALRSIAQGNGSSAEAELARARRLVLELARELARLGRTSRPSSAEEGRIRQLGQQPILPTCAGSFTRAEPGVLVPDDDELLRELGTGQADVASRVLAADPEAAGELRPLAAFFGLPLLSEHMQRAVLPECLAQAMPERAWGARLRSGVPFFAQLAHDAAPEMLEGSGRETALELWCALRRELDCAIVPGLCVERRVEGLSALPHRVRLEVFGDLASKRVFVDRAFMLSQGSGAWLDVVGEAARLFAAELPPECREAFQQRAQLLLSAPGPPEMHRLLKRGSLRSVRPLPDDVLDLLTTVAAQGTTEAEPKAASAGGAAVKGRAWAAEDRGWATAGHGHAGGASWAKCRADCGSGRPGAWGPSSCVIGETLDQGSWPVSSAQDAPVQGGWQLPDKSALQPEGEDEPEEAADYEMPKLLARLLDAAESGDTACAEAVESWVAQAPPAAAETAGWGGHCQGPTYVSCEWSGSVLSQAWGRAWHEDQPWVSGPASAGLRMAIHGARQLHWRGSVEAAIRIIREVFCENGGPAVMRGRRERLLGQRVEWLPASELRFSHHRISPKFGSGAHRGRDIQTLVEALGNCKVAPADLVICGVRFRGRVHTLNNRRLYALKEHDRLKVAAKGTILWVPVKVYEMCPITAKFILSYSTTNEGVDVEVGF